MKLEKSTLDVLKNFATINSNLLIREGNVLSTVSNKKNVFARAELAQKFDKEFAIYDLNSLLSILSIAEDADITLGETSLAVVKDKSCFEYYYADKNIITTAPEKAIEIDDFFTFTLGEKELNTLMRAAASIAAPILTFKADGSTLTAIVSDPETPNTNNYKTVICDCDKTFTAKLSIENLKVISSSYTITVSKKNVLQFANEASNVNYWIALEKGSEI